MNDLNYFLDLAGGLFVFCAPFMLFIRLKHYRGNGWREFNFKKALYDLTILFVTCLLLILISELSVYFWAICIANPLKPARKPTSNLSKFITYSKNRYHQGIKKGHCKLCVKFLSPLTMHYNHRIISLATHNPWFIIGEHYTSTAVIVCNN